MRIYSTCRDKVPRVVCATTESDKQDSLGRFWYHIS